MIRPKAKKRWPWPRASSLDPEERKAVLRIVGGMLRKGEAQIEVSRGDPKLFVVSLRIAGFVYVPTWERPSWRRFCK